MIRNPCNRSRSRETRHRRRDPAGAAALCNAESRCLLYTPHRDLERTERFVFVECWASRAALAEHEGTEHFKELIRELTPLLAHPLGVTVLEALLETSSPRLRTAATIRARRYSHAMRLE